MKSACAGRGGRTVQWGVGAWMEAAVGGARRDSDTGERKTAAGDQPRWRMHGGSGRRAAAGGGGGGGGRKTGGLVQWGKSVISNRSKRALMVW